jgi:hypothetical protein
MNKTKIKQTIVAVSIILTLLLAGCSNAGGFFKGSSQPMETFKFRTGTDGLDMKFADGMPPAKVYIGTEFTIGIKVKNAGAYSIKDRANMRMTMPDPSVYMFKQGNDMPFTLDGKSLYVKDGAEDLVTFPVKAMCFQGYSGTRGSIVTNYTSKLKAIACYYYETTANADLCIDTRKFTRPESEKASCQMKDISLSGGQGGPVGVQGVALTIIPQSAESMLIQLGITIKKLKGSEYSIFHPEAGCGLAGQNNITVEVELGGERMECKPSTVQLKESGVSTICTKKINPKLGAYTSPLSVNMKYYVQQSVIKDINIEPPPGGVDCNAIKGNVVSYQ